MAYLRHANLRKSKIVSEAQGVVTTAAVQPPATGVTLSRPLIFQQNFSKIRLFNFRALVPLQLAVSSIAQDQVTLVAHARRGLITSILVMSLQVTSSMSMCADMIYNVELKFTLVSSQYSSQYRGGEDESG